MVIDRSFAQLSVAKLNSFHRIPPTKAHYVPCAILRCYRFELPLCSELDGYATVGFHALTVSFRRLRRTRFDKGLICLIDGQLGPFDRSGPKYEVEVDN